MGVREKLATLAPFALLKGYAPSHLPKDFAAGAVIAALSIPIAMGYAQIAGLPAGYGLLASIVAPLSFALITGTKSIVFGMDSATAAITGAVLVGLGYGLGSAELAEVMPLFTLMVAAFLVLFALCRVGRVMRLVPIPVINGFIVGVSLSVIVSQIPILAGFSVASVGGFFGKCAGILGGLGQTNALSVGIGVVSIAALFVLQKAAPKVPGALIVLVVMTVCSVVFGFAHHGVAVLGEITLALPHLSFPALDPIELVMVVGSAFAVALIVALESLLCLQTFSIRAGVRANGDRELASFGLANAVCGLFGCPPCSASISRTAAGIAAGSHSQFASIGSAVVVAIVSLLLAPLLYMLPRSCLSAIIIVALINVVDTRTIKQYAQHMKIELVIFIASAAVVLVFGALPGVGAGVALSIATLIYRKHHDDEDALFGVLPKAQSSGKKPKGKPDPGVDYLLFKMSGNLTFVNIDRLLDKLLSEMTPQTEAVIIKISKVETIDATATVKLLQLVDMLDAREIRVMLVRKVRPVSDDYTRYELASIIQDADVYPNVRTALEVLKGECACDRSGSAADGEQSESPGASETARGELGLSGDAPEQEVVLSVQDKEDNGSACLVTGHVDLLNLGEIVVFGMELHRKDDGKTSSEKGKPKGGGKSAKIALVLFSAVLSRERTGEILAEFDDGKWDYAAPVGEVKPAVDALESYFLQ